VVLKEIQRQTSFKFVYVNSLVDVNKKVSIDVKNGDIVTVMNKLLSGTDITYKIVDKQITLSPKDFKNDKENPQSGQKDKQNLLTIKGKVTGKNSDPLSGVFLVQKGTTNAVTTNNEGVFTIKVTPGSILSVTLMGYKQSELAVNDERPLDIVLEEDMLLLDEVVFVGYGVQKKKLLTGATIQVKGEDIDKLNTVNALGALQSQSPGVNIVQNNGFLNAGYKVNIRGIGTTGSSSPLYVVDGVANGSIDNLNPSDIESIDVLKDAASSAIYGARAANGVILITTKHGKTGQSQVSFDSYYGMQNLYKIPTILNAKEYMYVQDEARVMDGYQPYNWGIFIPAADLSDINNGTWKGTNWLKEIINKDAPVQNYALNITGGKNNSTYSIGFSYTNQESTMGVPDAMPNMERYNFRVNTDNTVIKKGDLDFLKVGETVNYKYSETHGSFGTGGIYWNGVHNMLVMSPLMHAYNADGSYYVYADRVADGYNWDISNAADKNPIAYLDYFMNQNVSKSHYLQSSMYADLQPINNLHIKSQIGYIMGASSYRSYQPVCRLSESAAINTVDKVSQSMSLYNRWSWENTVNYIFNYNDHTLDILAGQSLEKWGLGESLSASNTDSNFTDLEHAYLSNVSTIPGSTSSISGYPMGQGAIASFFARANYNYKERYMGSAIIRADGSSVFARGKRWGYFPSFSAGWVISNENFMAGIKNLDFLKLRASWGQNGNCNVSTFQYLSLITSNNGYGGYTFGDVMNTKSIGSYAYKLTNPDLSWETSEQLNIGFDARMFRSRLAMEFDWYNKITKDWLVVAPILYSYGASAPYVNGGNVKNTGLELALHWNDSYGKDFYYGANLSLAHNKNKITKIANDDGIIHGVSSVLWEGSDECYRAEVGYPIGYFYGYKTAGIFQNQEQINNYKGALLNGSSTQPGDVIWVDNDNNGTIDSGDRTMIGNPNPDLTMGLSFNAGWKAVDITITTFGAFGQQILKCYRDFSSSPLNNYTTDIFNRWHGEGTSNKYPRLTSASSSNWTTVSDLYIENGDYLKIQNITLGFDFKKAFPKLPFTQLRLYMTAQNLFTFTGYSGMDPEIGYGGDSDGWASGIDLGYYPSARTFIMGLNIKF
jgi:TonB-linked SusC/RagA family outer membrane protein